MIRALILLVAIAGCSSSSTAIQDAAVHLDGLSCVPSGTCTTGPPCGSICCPSGEACINGACMCGTNGPCTGGNMCISPVVMVDRCGGICCGATSVCPGVEGP